MNEVNDGYTSYINAGNEDIWPLMNMVKPEIKYLLFSRIARELSFTWADWAKFLHLSERTLQRYKKENRDFNPIYSEKIMEIALLCKKGVAVFGNRKNFDHFIRSRKYPVLKVPSAVVPGDYNFLMNPAHPDFLRIKIMNIEPFEFDSRLFRD